MAVDRAVLTGGFVRPKRTTSADVDAAFAVLAEAARDMTQWHGAPPGLTRFQGDRWQCLLAKPGLALRSALFLHARLSAGGARLETRIAVGIGPIERPGTRDLSDASGIAFQRAEKVFSTMRRGRRLLLARDGARPPAPVIFTLADALCQRWTKAQAEVLCHALPPGAPIQSDIAARLGTKQQNVAARLDAAGFWALEDAMAAIEAVLGQAAH
jgi:hypothetical protein